MHKILLEQNKKQQHINVKWNRNNNDTLIIYIQIHYSTFQVCYIHVISLQFLFIITAYNFNAENYNNLYICCYFKTIIDIFYHHRGTYLGSIKHCILPQIKLWLNTELNKKFILLIQCGLRMCINIQCVLQVLKNDMDVWIE